MITTVTGGTVSIEDGTKAAEEYAPARKVRVDLNFSIPEGGSAAPVLDAVSTLASEKVDQLLGRRRAPLSATSEPTPATPALPKETPAAEPKPSRAKKKDEPAPPATPAPADDPLGLLSGEPAPETPPPAEAAGEAAEESLDIFSSGPTAPAATDISDEDLNAAVQKRNAELKEPTKIRTLIGSFNPDPTKVFQLREVPQDQRQKFLDQLAALA